MGYRRREVRIKKENKREERSRRDGLSGVTGGITGLRIGMAGPPMGDSMDFVPELSGETWVAATYLEEVTADLPTAESEPDLIVASRLDEKLGIVREWVRAGSAHCDRSVQRYLRSYGASKYSSGICQSIRIVDCGAAGFLRPRLPNWWCPSVSIGSLFGDIMILSSLDIWVFPEWYID